MAIARVQGNARGTASNSNTVSVTLSSTPTNGNLLIAVIGIRTININVSSIAQTGVTWTKQVSKNNWDEGQNLDVEIWAGVVGSGASTNITITLSGSASNAVADVCEYSGLPTSGFLDKTATNKGLSAYPDTGTTATTSWADELWIGATNTQGGDQSNPTNGFTLLDGITYAYALSVGYLEKIVSSTGTANSGTTTPAGNYWVGCIATFGSPIKAKAIVKADVGPSPRSKLGFFPSLKF
jgi:hypothetical protein